MPSGHRKNAQPNRPSRGSSREGPFVRHSEEQRHRMVHLIGGQRKNRRTTEEERRRKRRARTWLALVALAYAAICAWGLIGEWAG